MGNFVDELKKNSMENTEDKRIEREVERILKKLNEFILGECVRKSKIGGTNVTIYIDDLLKTVIERSENCEFAEEVIYKYAGDGFKQDMKVFIDPDRIRNSIEDNLKANDLNNYDIKPREVPLFQIYEKDVENSTGVKALSGALNLFFDAKLDVEYTTKKIKKKIGTQTFNFVLQIDWS